MQARRERAQRRAWHVAGHDRPHDEHGRERSSSGGLRRDDGFIAGVPCATLSTRCSSNLLFGSFFHFHLVFPAFPIPLFCWENNNNLTWTALFPWATANLQ